jgi:multisubunit Na+/H+ antiporter MnhE subunit
MYIFLRLLVTANVPSSPIIVTLMMEVVRSSETSVLTTSMELSPSTATQGLPAILGNIRSFITVLRALH